MTDVSPTLPVGPGPSRFRRWLVPALVASLSLNLLVAGFVLGHAGGPGRHRPGFGGPPMSGPAGPIGKFVGDLPSDRRDALKGLVDEQRKAQAALSPAVKTARRELAEALRAAPFERAKLEAALQKLAGAENALRMGTAGPTSQLVEKLTDPERANLERMLRRISAFMDDGRDPETAPKAP